MPKPNKGGGDSNVISGNKRDNTLTGTSADEVLDGKGGNDRLTGGGGDDTILGGSGTDTAVYAYARDAYEVTLLGDGRIQISGPEGTDTLSDVELFEFADMTQTAADVILPRFANLSAQAVQVEDTVLSPGEVTDVSVSIASDGVIDATASSVDLVIATAPDEGAIIDTIDTAQLGALATGSSDSVSFTLDPGALQPGTYWVAVRVDSGDALTEEDETDNLTEWVQITVEAPSADLQLLSASVGDGSDLDLDGGARIEIDYVIQDASNMDVSGYTVATYISTDATISEDDQRISVITGGTDPEMTTNVTGTHWLPEGFAPGTYHLISVVEWDDGSTDTQPDNNTIVHTVTLTPPPAPVVDLSVGMLSIAASSDLDLGPEGYLSGPTGGQLDFSFDVSNLGSDPAINTGFTAYLSTDGTVSGDDIVIWSGSATLTAGGSATLTGSASLDAGLSAGDYQVILVADAQNEVDSSNNSGTADVTLIGGSAVGTEGNDVWVGTAGGDSVDLLGGDDIAFAGSGLDTVDSGDGVDTLDFSGRAQGVQLAYDFVFDPEDPQYLVEQGATEAQYINFETLILTAQDDHIDLSAGAAATVKAGAGNDLIFGSAGDDILEGGAGDDLIAGYMGNDTISTGEGNDMVGVARNASADGVSGFGHDVVDDFDFNFDAVVINVGYQDTYDPMVDLIQTSEGALLQYADDSSLLLEGVDVADLDANHFIVVEDEPAMIGI